MSNIDERKDVALSIRSFLDGTGGDWEFDDLINQDFHDDLVREAISALMDIQDRYPSDVPNKFCNDTGLKKIREIADRLEA